MKKPLLFTLASYTFTRGVAPSLCEAVQRRLDAVDPRLVLEVKAVSKGPGARTVQASVLGPDPGQWRASSIFYCLVEAMKTSGDAVLEFERRMAGNRGPA